MLNPTMANEFDALLDAAVDGIVLINDIGIIQAFNRSAERLFGFASKEALGRNVTVLMDTEDAAGHDAHLRTFLLSRVPRVIGRGREVTARRKDGTVFPAFLSVGMVANSDPVRYVGFIQDLSTRRGAEEDARRLQERLWHVSRLATMGEMATGIAHELNQPLAAIANYSQACDRLLAKPEADLPEIRDALREITEQAVRAGEIIRKLRALVAHPDGTSLPTDINHLVTQLTSLLQSSVKAHDITCQLDLGRDLPQLDIQPVEIQQVILDLVRNAIESFSPSGSAARTIVIRTVLTAEGDVAVSVCDNGSGVAAHIAPSMFDPFYSSKDNGTGLGLAMSRTIVSRYGGKLKYLPNHPTGACFTLQLPATSKAHK
jgi:two-component system, LuxR family, sensor kinase FixL